MNVRTHLPPSELALTPRLPISCLLAVITLSSVACDKREDRESRRSSNSELREDRAEDRNPFVATREDPRSTFSIDVDTASYSNVRRYLLAEHRLPPADVVRTEELINYFDYDYPQPLGPTPFSLTTEVGPCPWNLDHQLVHIGVQGRRIESDQLPPRNLVFLLDTSGSMQPADRLPLVELGLAALTEQLGPDDRVSIVVYSGSAGVVLPPTSGADKPTILAALDRLEAGGSTNGGAGIELAYALAEQSFVAGGVNRVVLATDGDFNVGVTDHTALIDLIEAKRETGVYLSVLGVGRGNLDDHTMEQLADHGNGNYAYLDGELEARKVLVAEAGATLVTIAKDVKIQVEFDPERVVEHRLIGYENRVLAHHEFDDDRTDAGEIGAGHSVTAIYEIAPAQLDGQPPNLEPSGDPVPLLRLDLRYKQPEGDGPSEEISVLVTESNQSLAASSDEFRFAAAVAAFGERLGGAEGPAFADIRELAEGSLGSDTDGHRREFLELVEAASTLAADRPELAEQARAPEPAPCGLDRAKSDTERSAPDGFWRDVLLLLPVFLALPMFVAAHSRSGRKL